MRESDAMWEQPAQSRKINRNEKFSSVILFLIFQLISDDLCDLPPTRLSPLSIKLREEIQFCR